VYSGMAQESEVTRLHPAQKPEWLIESLIRDFTDPGDVILDPYAGSGTTLVSAKRLGRSSLGWERQENYFNQALQRIDCTSEQLELVIPKKPKPKQESLL